MAKGAQSKIDTYAQLMSVFPNSFMYNDGKELRIPLIEDGVDIQLKLVLTCAKDNVEPGGDTILPGTVDSKVPIQEGESPKFIEPTEEEIEAVNNLVQKLGL